MDQDGKVDGTSDNRQSSLRGHEVASRRTDRDPDENSEQAISRSLSSVAPTSEKLVNTLTDADGGTNVHGKHDGLPSGVSTADNELGWRLALEKLAALIEIS
jgi:hypothetical protein